MSKLTTSLRESITAEKQSVKEKESVSKPVAAKINKPQLKKAVSPVGENAIKAKSTSLFDELKYKLDATNLPLPLNYEALSLLMRANLLEKVSNNMAHASTVAANMVHECIEAPLCSISEMVSLNATASCQALDRVSTMVQELTATKNPIEFFTCLNQIIAQNVENSKNYWQNLSVTLGASRQKINKAWESKNSYTWEQITQSFNPWK
ncbi:MAG: hypothetical protein KBD37_00395 [Burkholderiales bacterium]|nr:hypothetical protein [Burkholderiales bacterium]